MVTSEEIKNISLIFGYPFKQKFCLYTFGPNWCFLDGNPSPRHSGEARGHNLFCTGSQKLAGKLSYVSQLLLNFNDTLPKSYRSAILLL